MALRQLCHGMRVTTLLEPARNAHLRKFFAKRVVSTPRFERIQTFRFFFSFNKKSMLHVPESILNFYVRNTCMGEISISPRCTFTMYRCRCAVSSCLLPIQQQSGSLHSMVVVFCSHACAWGTQHLATSPWDVIAACAADRSLRITPTCPLVAGDASASVTSLPCLRLL